MMKNEKFKDLLKSMFTIKHTGIDTITAFINGIEVEFYAYKGIGDNLPDANWKVSFILINEYKNILLGRDDLNIKLFILVDLIKEISHINEKINNINSTLVKFNKKDKLLFREYKLKYYEDFG